MTRLFAGLGACLVLAQAGFAQGPPPSQDFPVRVFLLTRFTMMQEQENGLVLPMRSSLEPSQMEEIQASIRDFSTQLASLSGGVLVPKVTVEEDAEQVVWLSGGLMRTGDSSAETAAFRGTPGRTLRSQLIQGTLAPRINQDVFQANDGVYRGPYRMVFVIHPGLAGGDFDFRIEGTPGRAIGWSTFTSQEPKAALVSEMLNAAFRLAGGPNDRRPKPPAPSAPSAYGEAELTSEGSALKLVSTGIVARGGAFLRRVNVAETPILRLKAKGANREPIGLNFVGSSGPIASVLLRGSLVVPHPRVLVPQTSGVRLEAADSWTDFSIDLRTIPGGENITEIHLGTPALVTGPFEKGPPEQTVIEVSDISLGGGEAAQTLAPQPLTSDAEQTLALVNRLRSSAPLTEQELVDAGAAAAEGSSLRRFSVLSALMVRRDPKTLPLLAAAAGGGGIGEAWLAAQALFLLETPEARAALTQVLRRGPFDLNRRFAAEVLQNSALESEESLLNMMLLQRGWRGRLAAVRALAARKTQSSQVVLTASMAPEQEPNPMVRLTIVEALDPQFELAARRLLYSAVNDPINWVRAAAYAKLVDSSFDSIRLEALKGVRDDAPSVRKVVLQTMIDRPNAAYRSALRLAVADALAPVRAMALAAFAVMPGTVEPGEIQNTFQDSDEAVQLALVRLAAAQKVVLPSEVVAALKASPHESVRTAAARLGG